MKSMGVTATSYLICISSNLVRFLSMPLLYPSVHDRVYFAVILLEPDYHHLSGLHYYRFLSLSSYFSRHLLRHLLYLWV